MIRLSKLFTVAFLLGSTNHGHAAADPAILGLWARGDGVARVRIAPCGGALCAVNTWIKPGVADEKVGDRLVMEVKPAGPFSLSGAAFDPQRNLNYRLNIHLTGRTMTTRGCVLGGLLCRSVGWTRLSED
jgi:uncharacterized protein (DUF2147 family)